MIQLGTVVVRLLYRINLLTPPIFSPPFSSQRSQRVDEFRAKRGS